VKDTTVLRLLALDTEYPAEDRDDLVAELADEYPDVAATIMIANDAA
jgi:hypothetical protein